MEEFTIDNTTEESETTMPAVEVKYPAGLFSQDEKRKFRNRLKAAVAQFMDAIDPATGKKTEYYAEPDEYVDVLLTPYELEDADMTTVCLGTIVTYEWPDRMVNMEDRLNSIAAVVKRFIPANPIHFGAMDTISFTFLGKQDGCWVAV